MRRMLPALALLAALAAAAGLRERPRTMPQRRPPAQAQPWMADALPGIGPARRDLAAAAIRAGRIADLPAEARPAARAAFSGW